MATTSLRTRRRSFGGEEEEAKEEEEEEGLVFVPMLLLPLPLPLLLLDDDVPSRPGLVGAAVFSSSQDPPVGS